MCISLNLTNQKWIQSPYSVPSRAMPRDRKGTSVITLLLNSNMSLWMSHLLKPFLFLNFKDSSSEGEWS